MKKKSLIIMAAIYIIAGINHFWNPAIYINIMPPWLPEHKLLVAISGAFEIVLGVLLLFPSTQRQAAWGIILLLIAVFPANIQMMINYWNESNPMLWIAILRLPLQIVLIRWAYAFTKKRRTKSY